MAEEGPQDWSERTISTERKRAEQAAQDARAQLLEAKEQEEKNSEFIAAGFEAVIAANEERIRDLQDRMAELDRLSLKALTDAQEELDELRRNANRARDGRNVYRAADGNIYDEDGKLVAHEAIDWSTWREDGPTREQYEQELRARDRVVEYRERLREQQERLEQNPDEEDLDEIEEELDELEAGMDETLGAGYERAQASSEARTTSVAKTLDGDREDVVSTRQPFYAAATGIAPEIDDRPDAPLKPGAFTPV